MLPTRSSQTNMVADGCTSPPTTTPHAPAESTATTDDAPSTGARTTLGTYSTLSTLSNDGILPYDLGATANNLRRLSSPADEYAASPDDSHAVGVGGQQQRAVLTASALLVSDPSTPLSVSSVPVFPGRRDTAAVHNSQLPHFHRPTPLPSTLPPDDTNNDLDLFHTSHGGGGLDGEVEERPYVSSPHPAPPSLLSPAVATPVSRLAAAARAHHSNSNSRIVNTTPQSPQNSQQHSQQVLKYKATRDWVGTAPELPPPPPPPFQGGHSPSAELHYHQHMPPSRTNTFIAVTSGGGGFGDRVGESSPNLSVSANGGADFEFDWASCSPGGDSRLLPAHPQFPLSSPTAPQGSSSYGVVSVVGGGAGAELAASCGGASSALSEPNVHSPAALRKLSSGTPLVPLQRHMPTANVAESRIFASFLDENAANFPTLAHCSMSREPSEHQFETCSNVSVTTSHHSAAAAVARMSLPPSLLAGASTEEPPEPMEDLGKEDREAILINNSSPPVYLLNRQEQAQQLLRCYLAFSTAEKLFGAARVSYSSTAKGGGVGGGTGGGDLLKRNRFLISAAAAASAFHMFGGASLAGHPTAASLAAANFRSVFAAASALQVTKSQSTGAAGATTTKPTGTTQKSNSNGNTILSSILYGQAHVTSNSYASTAFNNIHGFGHHGSTTATTADNRATGAAAARAIPPSPDKERNVYIPNLLTSSSSSHPTKRIVGSKGGVVMVVGGRGGAQPTAAKHGIISDNSDETNSDIFGGDSFDTWVSGVIVPSFKSAQFAVPAVPAAGVVSLGINGSSSAFPPSEKEGTDSRRCAEVANRPPVDKYPPHSARGWNMPPRDSSWASGLSSGGLKARTDDWDELIPSPEGQGIRNRHNSQRGGGCGGSRSDFGFDVCSVGASSSKGMASPASSAILVKGGGGARRVRGSAAVHPKSTTAAAAHHPPPCQGLGGGLMRDPLRPGVLPRAGSSWASVSSIGKRQLPHHHQSSPASALTTTTTTSTPSMNTVAAATSAQQQYQLDNF